MTNPAGNIDFFDPSSYTGYVTGLVTSYASTTTLSVSAGSCRDVTDSSNITVSTATTLNGAVNGLNGLDTGTLAANTVYYVHAVGDSMGANPSGFVISTSESSPVMPVGTNGQTYDMLRALDFVKTNGSAQFLLFQIIGRGRERVHYWYSPIALTLGSSGAATTLTSIDCSGAVPYRKVLVLLSANFTPNAANDYVTFTPGDASVAAGPVVYGNVAAKISSGALRVPTGNTDQAPAVKYINSAATGLTAASVMGFEYCV